MVWMFVSGNVNIKGKTWDNSEVELPVLTAGSYKVMRKWGDEINYFSAPVENVTMPGPSSKYDMKTC